MTDLELFQTVTRAEAIEAFRSWRAPKTYCRDQFVVCGKAILFFAPAIGTDRGTRLLSPTSIEWWPDEVDDYPGEKTRWLPDAVQPKFDQKSKTWRRRSYLFLPHGDDTWLYCGPVHQAYHQYAGAGRFYDGSHVGYHLGSRLPYETWVALGGYPAWLAKIAGQDHRLDVGDAELKRLLTALPDGQTHVELTRWQGDSLAVYLNDERGFPMYLTDPGDSGTYVLGAQGADQLEHFACPCCGIDMEFSRQYTLPRDEALSVFLMFSRDGQAPEVGTEWLAGKPWERA